MGTLENIPIGIGKGIAGAASIVASNLLYYASKAWQGEEEGAEPVSKSEIYKSIYKSIADVLNVTDKEEPQDFASEVLRGAGEMLPQLLLLGPLGKAAAMTTEAAMGGTFAENLPYLYAKAFPIVRDALTFAGYGALEPEQPGRQAAIGAGVGGVLGALSPYGRFTRIIGGAGIGAGQEYLTNPNATVEDYARSATLMGAFAGIAKAHGLTMEEAITGTLFDWIKKQPGGPEAVARALQMNGHRAGFK